MKILLLAPSFPPSVEAGGPARSLANLVARHSGSYEFCVVTPVLPGEADAYVGLQGRTVKRRGVEIYYVDFSMPSQAVSLWRRLSGQRFDLVLVNSVWNRNLALVPLMLRRMGFQRRARWVLAPRGELDPGALDLKPRRKRVAARVVFPLIGSTVDVLSATSDVEESQARRLIDRVPVVRATNIPDALQPNFVRGERSAGLRVVFVGRISRKKGLLELIQALALVSAKVTLTIFGPIEDAGYWAECRAAIQRLGEAQSVVYSGVVDRVQLPRCFAEADLFVFPTRGENFGHTIAESLQVGCPVVVPDATPWTPYLADIRAAILPAGPAPAVLAAAIDSWAALDHESLVKMRRQARGAFDRWADAGSPDMIQSLLDGPITINVNR